MRHLIQVLAVGAMFLSSGSATADQLFKLLASDGAREDRFGISIAIDNGIVAIGVPNDDDLGTNSGSAYLFDASTGAQIAKLRANDGAEREFFGVSIAIDNGIVAIGAWRDGDSGGESGSAYLFDASTGAQIAKLLPIDGAAGDHFGFSIAIDNGIVAIGAPEDDDLGGDSGSAYLFDASTGDQIVKLQRNDGAAGDLFGTSIAIDNGIVAVGARWDDDNGFDSGSAYLFQVSTGAQIAKLLPNDGEERHQFGFSIAIDNGIVAVGAVFDDDNGSGSGSAYLFDASTGAQIAKLLPDDGAFGDFFGDSIAIDNGIVAVGADGDDDNGSSSGSAYLFDASTGSQIAKLLPDDGTAIDQFGSSIAIDNGIVAIGVRGDDDLGPNSGSAYLFDASGPPEITATLTDLAVVTGTILDGDITDLESSDDSYIHTRSGFGSSFIDLHNMEMRISAITTVQAPATLDLTIESRIDQPAGTAQIGLLNHTTQRFDSVGQFALGNTDAIGTILDIDATNYVNSSGGGDIELSIKHIVFVPFLVFAFESWVDWVAIDVR